MVHEWTAATGTTNDWSDHYKICTATNTSDCHVIAHCIHCVVNTADLTPTK
jgi:hypothetical protein